MSCKEGAFRILRIKVTKINTYPKFEISALYHNKSLSTKRWMDRKDY